MYQAGAATNKPIAGTMVGVEAGGTATARALVTLAPGTPWLLAASTRYALVVWATAPQFVASTGSTAWNALDPEWAFAAYMESGNAGASQACCSW